MPYNNIGNTQFHNQDKLSDPRNDRRIQRDIGLGYLRLSTSKNTQPLKPEPIQDHNSQYSTASYEQPSYTVDSSQEASYEQPRNSTFVSDPSIYDTAQQDRIAAARANMANAISIDTNGTLSDAQQTPRLDSRVDRTMADQVGQYEMTQEDYRQAA